MARLTTIELTGYALRELKDGGLEWAINLDKGLRHLPQIFWENGRGWDEVNVWALRQVEDGADYETVKSLMKALQRYANFLELNDYDWRHFPQRKEDQVLRAFRKSLMSSIEDGTYASSTASSTMYAVIRFYNFAKDNNLISPNAPLWSAEKKIRHFIDARGFARAMVRDGTDLAIPLRARIGNGVEDGLLPLSAKDAKELMKFSSQKNTIELHLMLAIGMFTGARVGTVITLTGQAIQGAVEHPVISDLYLIRVGPGTAVRTKFNVSGDLEVPKQLLLDLKKYLFSTRRLLRLAKNASASRDTLFLNRYGRPYSVATIDSLVSQMRKRAINEGLTEFKNFVFHETRATFGTARASVLLNIGLSRSEAVDQVRTAMFHKDESSTLRYIKFVDKASQKSDAANRFYEETVGLRNEDWNALGK
ncbi:hypothetical protein CAL22_17995 [Bordetella genomosp. 12]|uniref:Tyr recombinase domain-containing protein n=2 Tax=Bordetella genomosp. 12 TaxID=463035 RepID=A0A261VDN0_9BORD|nr:hypothetical protein CAL22_17995 [Bordetella genomosp. 12]